MGPTKLAYRLTLAFALGSAVISACSPISPSASKFSNAQIEQSNTTDGSSPATPPTTESVSESLRPAPAAHGAQTTSIVPITSISRTTTLVRLASPTISLDQRQIEALAREGRVSIRSSQSAIEGREDDLLEGTTRVRLGMDLDSAGIRHHNLSRVTCTVLWHAATPEDPGHWEVSLDNPDMGDAVRDMNESTRVQQILRDHLRAVSIEFAQTSA